MHYFVFGNENDRKIVYFWTQAPQRNIFMEIFPNRNTLENHAHKFVDLEFQIELIYIRNLICVFGVRASCAFEQILSKNIAESNTMKKKISKPINKHCVCI